MTGQRRRLRAGRLSILASQAHTHAAIRGHVRVPRGGYAVTASFHRLSAPLETSGICRSAVRD